MGDRFEFWKGRLATLGGVLVLLVASAAMLASASGAQAASRRAVLVKDIRPGHSGSSSGYKGGCYSCYAWGGPLASAGGILYLSVDDGRHGFELWKSDGTGKGTKMVKDINPGSEWSSIYPLAVVNRTFYFGASDGVHGFELWRSDGTGKGTTMVKDLNPGPGDGSPGWATGFGGSLYFAAWDGTEGGRGLWRTDGTAAGTSLVKHVSGGIGPPAEAGGALYFGVANGYSELWRSDGTTAGTTLVKGGFLNSLEELTDFQGAVYFRADDGVNKPALWRSDGTEAGTTMVKRVNSANPYLPCCFTVSDGSLYFLSSDTSLVPERALAKRRDRGGHDSGQGDQGRHRGPHRRQEGDRVLPRRAWALAQRRNLARHEAGQGRRPSRIPDRRQEDALLREH